MKKNLNNRCITAALEILGDKWSPLIVKSFDGMPQLRYCEIERAVDGISPAILSARLNALEERGVIVRSQYSARPPRFAYGLTTKGSDLLQIIAGMADWADKYAT